jgi:hypothetical protein
LKEEYEALIETRENAKDELKKLRRRWRKADNYSAWKLPNGKTNWEGVFGVFMVALLTVALITVIVVRFSPESFYPGEQLDAGAVYTCDECGWEGNMTAMAHFDSAAVMQLHCPICGEHLGWYPYGEDL